MEDDGLLEDMKFDADLEGFFSGSTSGTVNLQPQPTSFGISVDEGQPITEGSANKTEDSSTATAVGAAAAGAAAAATALMGGKFSVAQSIVGGAMDSVVTSAVPTSLQPVKEQAGRCLQKARPWREFLLPLSVPAASEGCSRLTANIHNFQTNYAILFVLQLVVAIVFQPSALICLIITVVAWMFFLKKNDDPDWAPAIGGMQLGPIQRLLLLALVTAIILLFVTGSAIFNTVLLYVMFAFAHGIVHEPGNSVTL